MSPPPQCPQDQRRNPAYYHPQDLIYAGANGIWAFGQSLMGAMRAPGPAMVQVQTETQVTQFVIPGGQFGGRGQLRRGRRSSDPYNPTPTFPPIPRPMSTPYVVGSPVIPGVTTNGGGTGWTPNVLRKNPPATGRAKILFYHKHQPHYGFTNFSPHPVMYNGKRYPTSEHLFQSFKFIHKPHLMEHIRTCDPRPSVAFAEARKLAHEVRSNWKQENIAVMDIVLYHKFTQHDGLKRELLATANAELIENSDKDSFWGCGADGKGRNELGKALERLRGRLRN